jgi:hypothetical protein
MKPVMQNPEAAVTIYCYRWESPPVFMKEDGANSGCMLSCANGIELQQIM